LGPHDQSSLDQQQHRVGATGGGGGGAAVAAVNNTKKGKKKNTDSDQAAVGGGGGILSGAGNQPVDAGNHQKVVLNNNNNNSRANSKQTLNSNANSIGNIHHSPNNNNQNNKHLTSSSSSSISVDSPKLNRAASNINNTPSPNNTNTNPSNQAKLLALKVRRMEIGGTESANGTIISNANANNRSLNGVNDDSLNDSDKLDTFDHPPSKKLNMNNSSQQPMEESVGATVTTVNLNESLTPMDTAAAANNNDESMGAASATDATETDESRSEATCTFTIQEFSKFRESKESRLSPVYMVRNLPWRILAMSKPLNNNSREFVLGFFLQCNADSDSTRWSIYASAELRLLHTSDPEKNVVKSKIKSSL
jgi:hypothetical protein